MAFFGTPHRGSPWTGIGDKVAKAVRTISRNPSNTFLNALKKDGLYASELSANFGQLLENYRYLNFYETLPYKSIGLVSFDPFVQTGLSEAHCSERLSTRDPPPLVYPTLERQQSP